MPLQRVKLLFEKDEIEVKYKLNRDNLYEVMGSTCEIYHCDSAGIDMAIDSLRFYSHVTEVGNTDLNKYAIWRYRRICSS